MASLLLGMDFYESEVYIGLWNEEERKARSFVVPNLAEGECVPLFIIPDENGRFLVGKEAVEYSINSRKNGAGALYGKYIKPSVTLDGRTYDTEALLKTFIDEVISAIKKHFGGASISRICVTGENMDVENGLRIGRVLGGLGYTDRYRIVNHANAFLRYMATGDVLRRKQRAIAIDPNSKGAEIYAYVPGDANYGMPAYTERTDAANIVRTNPEDLSDEEKAKVFDELITLGIQKNRPVRHMYVTGRGAEDANIRKILLQHASETMKIFSGRNLYSSGACLFAVNESVSEKIIYDGQTFYSIYLEAYRDAALDLCELIQSGTDINSARAVIYAIPDDSSELTFHIKDERNGKNEVVLFSLDELEVRENKTNRLEIQARFLDRETLVIKVRDLGFGDINPATYRVWEQTILLQ